MNTERWQRIETIFNEALDRPADERAAFVRARCEDDDALYAEVMALLAADESPHSLLDASAIDAVDLPGDDDAAAGTLVGAYRIIRRIGSGGMGAVYLAERADGQFEQKVALKLIKRGMDSDAILARFRSERRILARLQHPGIARLLDGGVADDGRPYFTMEYVDGVPITEYCSRHALPLTQRLQLFRDVCAAVQYAHGNLVVHRDIKPGNILVTSDGVPKLLDFGIARLIDDHEEGLTRSGQRVMTPAYASPEQVRGEPVTTASDIYSLGVILYELLCERHPHRESTSTPAEVERAITTSPVERPSKSAPRWRRQLEGDLDTICLMALRKEPARRYASAVQLSNDIQRHLTGRTVSARPDTLRYRLGKFVGRNRANVALGAGVVVAAATLTAFYAHRLAHERDLARLGERKAAAVSEFLTGLFASADPYQSLGKALTAREMLDTGRKRVHTELAGQPRVLADMLSTIGLAYRNLGLYDEARSAMGEALEVRQRVLDPNDRDVVLAMAELADINTSSGDYTTAEKLARDAVSRARKLRDDPRPLAESVGYLATVLNLEGRYNEAEPFYRESIQAWQSVEGPRSPQASIIMNNLALMYHEESRYVDARTLFEQALSIQETAFGKRHPEMASTRYNYAQLLADDGQLEAARALWDDVLATDRALYPEGHPNIAYTLSAYGRLLVRTGDFEKAERLQREALDIRRKYLGETHPDVAYSLGSLGSVVYERGRYNEADTLLRESLAMHRKLHPEHPVVGNMMNQIGRVLYARGDYAAAEKMHRDALAFLRSVARGEQNQVAVSMTMRANDLAALGRLEEADTLSRSGYELARRIHHDRGLWVVGAMVDWAAIRLQRGYVAQAESLFTDGLSRMRAFESGSPQRPRDAPSLLGLGRCGLAKRDSATAEKYFREALAIDRRYFGDSHPRTARAETALASALMARGETNAARPLLVSARRVFASTVDATQVDRREAETLLARLE